MEGITITEINDLYAAKQDLEIQNNIAMEMFKREQLKNEELVKEVNDLKFKLNFIKTLINRVD